MAFNGVNPVSIGDPTRKTDYDRAFNNTLALQDGTAILDAVDIVTGAATAWGFHMGEAVNEGGWLISTTDNQLCIAAGVEYSGGAWTARATEGGIISMLNGLVYFYFDSGETPGNPGSVTLRMFIDESSWDLMSTFLQNNEMGDPAAPPVNCVRMYIRNLGGKTQLVAKFNTGAVQQIAIQP